MRQSFRRGQNDSDAFIFGNDGLIAMNLGADYCAEHEWGIKGIRDAFGMTDDGYGVERRMVRKVPEKRFRWVSLATGKRHAEGFWLACYSDDKEPPLYREPFYGDQTLWTGWSGGDHGSGDFGAFTIADAGKTHKHLHDLYDAINRLDACIWLGGGGVFENAGLVIGIKSRLQHHVLQAWEKADREREQLTKDAAATGIEDRLKKAGLGYFALSPRREDDGSLIFWLNPYEQHENNFGWFTVKDLDDWIAGKGRIPKTAEQRRNR